MELFVSLIIKQIKYNRQREPFDFVFPLNKLLTEPKSWLWSRLRKTDMCGEYIAILAERQIALFVNKWVLNNNCNLSSWFHVDIMCYIKHTHVFIFQKKWRTALPKNCRPTVGQQSANCWPTVGRLLADCRLPPFTKIGKSEEQLPQKTVGRLLVNSWPIVYRQSADRLLGELFFTFTPFFSAFLFHLQMKKLYLTNKKVVN